MDRERSSFFPQSHARRAKIVELCKFSVKTRRDWEREREEKRTTFIFSSFRLAASFLAALAARRS